MNHFYQKIDRWFDFQDIYKSAVRNATDGSHFVEIGIWKGGSTAFMGVEIYNSNKKIKFDAIDNFVGIDGYATKGENLYLLAKKNLATLVDLGLINIIKKDSLLASKLYKDESIDFCFIDGSHDYKSVKSDILAWLPKIKKGGIIAGHDYVKEHTGVIESVHECLNNFEVIGTSWLHNKMKI